MIARWVQASTLLLAMAGAATAAERPYPVQPAPSYPLQVVDQFDPTPAADVTPKDPAARAALARAMAMDAAIYGLPSVHQYREMFAQAVDRASPRYVGFNRFAHDRDLAGPDYKAFKSPNSDTLYSNAWLDLTGGPVLIETPDVPLKYYTLNFLDMFSNASNIGTRTFGSKAGRYLIAPAAWTGEPPPGVTLFRVATPHAWILMRVFAQTPAEVAVARHVQDSVKMTPLSPSSSKPPAYPRPDVDTAGGFFRVLDHVLRTNGHPDQEDALVYRLRAIGIGGPDPFDPARLDAETRAGMEAGFQDAMKLIAASRAQLGAPTGTGWSRVEKARYGFNYLSRATVNYVGLGANVDAENLSFNTFADGQGRPLDGSKGNYALALKPPPVNAFWSVTLYDATTLALYPNKLGRYLINDRTPGLKTDDGTIELRIQHARPRDAANWLPAPDRPFYLVVRSYLPKPEMISGGWRPEPVVMLEPKGAR